MLKSKEELWRFLLSYHTTPNTTTIVVPAQLLVNLEIKNDVQSRLKEDTINCRDLHRQNQDKKQRTTKFTTRVDPKPLTVTKVTRTAKW